MEDLFFRLLLGHLVGDFVLQFDAVYRLKARGAAGLAAHTAIVLVSTAVVAGPYLNGYVAALLVGAGVAHYLLDHLKNTSPRYPPALPGFLVDQAAHVVVLLVVAAAAGSAARPAPAWVVLAAGAIVATYVLSFVTHFLSSPPQGQGAPYRRVYSAYALQLVAYLTAAGAVLSHPAWAMGSMVAAAVQLSASSKDGPRGWPARWAGPVGAVLVGVACAAYVANGGP